MSTLWNTFFSEHDIIEAYFSCISVHIKRTCFNVSVTQVPGPSDDILTSRSRRWRCCRWRPCTSPNPPSLRAPVFKRPKRLWRLARLFSRGTTDDLRCCCCCCCRRRVAKPSSRGRFSPFHDAGAEPMQHARHIAPRCTLAATTHSFGRCAGCSTAAAVFRDVATSRAREQRIINTIFVETRSCVRPW